ncbi:hypothetical protein SeLEV6574_g04370 [Synchytrium endobioticum]|uniref:Uncharacterized protein n=1 Tax=Synchytrium endobioticum TaxID=286115 RepID=A0A507D0G0_9FUNG|nr:hypothetical protein SeLEV6574_g04370 [Synchytrium endobioticum]
MTNAKILTKIKDEDLRVYRDLCQTDRTFEVSFEGFLDHDEVSNHRGQGKWRPNPFRPLQSVSETPRYTSNRVLRRSTMNCPAPPELTRSLKVLEPRTGLQRGCVDHLVRS